MNEKIKWTLWCKRLFLENDKEAKYYKHLYKVNFKKLTSKEKKVLKERIKNEL